MAASFLQGHRQFLARYARRERQFLQDLAQQGQRPSALFIGCSDSRVVPELLTSAAPGELFVVRNVANLVPTFEHSDASVGAALEYAVVHLQVPHIIVCGHHGCGGVRAVLEGHALSTEEASLEEWLAGVRPAVAAAQAEGLAGDEALSRAVEHNVLLSLENLSTYPAVRRRLEEGRVELHGWLYDLHALHLLVYESERERFVSIPELDAQGKP